MHEALVLLHQFNNYETTKYSTSKSCHPLSCEFIDIRVVLIVAIVPLVVPHVMPRTPFDDVSLLPHFYRHHYYSLFCT